MLCDFHIKISIEKKNIERNIYIFKNKNVAELSLNKPFPKIYDRKDSTKNFFLKSVFF